jgi:hypothetical protein
MHVSLERLAYVTFFVGGFRLWRLYLTRLDAKEAEGTPSEQEAITASRRRAQGHLWVLGVVMASLFVFGLLFGVDHPPREAKTLLLVTAIAVTDAFFFHKALGAYEDAKRMRGNDDGRRFESLGRS